jgi:hypothetical protein
MSPDPSILSECEKVKGSGRCSEIQNKGTKSKEKVLEVGWGTGDGDKENGEAGCTGGVAKKRVLIRYWERTVSPNQRLNWDKHTDASWLRIQIRWVGGGIGMSWRGCSADHTSTASRLCLC